jgi:SAM-dependent methyltransferase
MGKKPSGKNIFDRIAGYYGLFFEYQKRKYNKLLDRIDDELQLDQYPDMIDMGCGTGAFCSELYHRGFNVTGLDSSVEMLKVARRKLNAESIRLVQGSFLDGTPFDDKQFDISFASFVSHGLSPEARQSLYVEMARITKHWIIIYDYNERRFWLTDFLEWLEGGDYFNFIKNVRTELKGSFKKVRVIDLGEQVSCYIAEP